MVRPVAPLLVSVTLAAALAACGKDPPERPAGFVGAGKSGLTLDGRPYRFLGANFWEGMNLGSRGPSGDRARLGRELDQLQSLGVTNLRILGASEGPDSEPWRVVPALWTEPHKYDADVLDGLDFLLSEIGRRGMKAVVMLSNFWPWSGGMSQYQRWHGGGPIPYPPPQPGGDWETYQRYTAGFYSNRHANAQFRQNLKFIIERVNPYTGKAYRDDPAIMAWQLANEPRGMHDTDGFNKWIAETARFIKSVDPHHLVSLGLEGDTPWPVANGLEFERNHDSPDIDYATIHIWAVNWGWYDPSDPATYAAALERTRRYLVSHLERARALGKPLVVEEFGMARDGGSHDPASGDSVRARFYRDLFAEGERLVRGGAPLAGFNFWAWSGSARPRSPGALWRPGDPLIGDPPHEHQGWNSVYATDVATLAVIREFAGRIARWEPGE